VTRRWHAAPRPRRARKLRAIVTSTGKRIASWQARPPVAPAPLEQWRHPPTGNTKPRMTIDRVRYALSGIAAGPDGTVVVVGQRTLETSYDCKAVSAQLPLHPAPADDDPLIQHAFAWVFDPADGRTIGASDLTADTNGISGGKTEACWSGWAYGASSSLVVSPSGHVLAGDQNLFEGLWGTGTDPVRLQWTYGLPFLSPGDGDWGWRTSIALTCHDSVVETTDASGYVYEVKPSGAWGTRCSAKPPKPIVALGPPVLTPSGRSVAATVACPGKGCSVVVALEPAQRCRGCKTSSSPSLCPRLSLHPSPSHNRSRHPHLRRPLPLRRRSPPPARRAGTRPPGR
jgi:outer membrane protein assembly factor BamB